MSKRIKSENYSSEDYWNSRYESNDNSHDWYYTFDILKPLINLAIQKISSISNFVDAPPYKNIDILEIGCGDRPLAIGISTQAPKSLHAIDYSNSIIKILCSNQNINDKINYKPMDARKMSYDDNSFDFIVEKGTIDAMLCCKNRKEAYQNAIGIISESVRIMKPVSSFMIISHIEVESKEFDELMQNVILPVLNDRNESIWNIEAHIVNASNNSNNRNVKKRVNENSYGTVYIIYKSIRKVTRNSGKMPSIVNFEVLEYSNDD